MARTIRTISGRVKTTPSNQLDADRYDYLSLDQAEPNLGVPESDGSVVVINADGTRTLTKNLVVNSLAFNTGKLDSADSESFYALFVKGNPFDLNVDSIGVRRLSIEALGGERDTLDTVTTRGNTTTNSIVVGGVLADSVTISGNLTVQGTTTTLNTTVLTIEDKNITLASGAFNASQADSAGITVQGANANIYYKSNTNTWNIDRATNIDSDLSVAGKLFLGNAEDQQTSLILYLDEVTGEVYASAPTGTGGGENTNKINVLPTDDSGVFYPTFVGVTSGFDSVNVDSSFSYDAAINQLSIGRLKLNQIPNLPSDNDYLVINANKTVGFRTIGALADLDSEQDTLQTVTDRGDSTDNPITVKKITTTDSAVVGGTLQFSDQFLDGSNRRLVIYDSVGAVLWG